LSEPNLWCLILEKRCAIVESNEAIREPSKSTVAGLPPGVNEFAAEDPPVAGAWACLRATPSLFRKLRKIPPDILVHDFMTFAGQFTDVIDGLPLIRLITRYCLSDKVNSHLDIAGNLLVPAFGRDRSRWSYCREADAILARSVPSGRAGEGERVSLTLGGRRHEVPCIPGLDSGAR
jgi:hypothetical protein